MVKEQETEIRDGFIIDINTGEILGMKEEFVPDTAEKVNWVLEKLLDCKAEKARNDVKRKAILDQLAALDKEIDRKSDFMLWKFGPALEEFAKKELEGQKAKSIKMVYGTLAFRSTGGTNKVVDPIAAVEWAKKHAPQSVKVTESFLVSKLSPEETQKALADMVLEPTEKVEKFEVKV